MISNSSDYNLENAGAGSLSTVVAVVPSLFAPSLNNGKVPAKGDWVTLMPLREALRKEWTSDAMIVGYRVTGPEGELGVFPRLSKGAWCRDLLNAGGYKVETTTVLVDVDIVGETKTPWSPVTRAEFDKWWADGKSHPLLSCAGVYLTKNGFRLFLVLNKPLATFEEAEAILAQVWIDLRATGLEASGSFAIDNSCKDCVRLMRAPRARKEIGKNLTPAFEDYSRVSPYTPNAPSSEAMDSLSHSGGSQARGIVPCGTPLPQIPAEWIPAATYLGQVIRAAGGRLNRLGWHQTYLAVAGAFLTLGASPEAIESIVAHVVEQDPKWSYLMPLRVQDARSTVARWCSGGSVMGLGALSGVFGSAAIMRFRSLAPVMAEVAPDGIEMVGDHPVTVNAATPAPRVWEVPDLLCPTDRARGVALMESLKAAAAEYRALMAERQSAAEKLAGEALHRGCQIANDKIYEVFAVVQTLHQNLGLTRINCQDEAVLKERAVRNTKTGRVVVVPLKCRNINCQDCGPHILASHVAGAFFGPVRRADGTWDLTPMADRKLYVYSVRPEDFATFGNQYRKAAKVRDQSSGWVAFQPSEGEYTVLSDIDLSQPGRRGSYTPDLIWVLNGRDSVLQFTLMALATTYTAVEVPDEFTGDLAVDLISPLGTSNRVAGKMASSDSLITRPQTITQQSRVHPWVQAAKSTTKELVASGAMKHNVQHTVTLGGDLSGGDLLTVRNVDVDTSSITTDERLQFEISIEKNEWAVKAKESRLGGGSPLKTVDVDFDALEEAFHTLMQDYG